MNAGMMIIGGRIKMSYEIDENQLEEAFYSHFEALTEEAQKEILRKLEAIFYKSKGWNINMDKLIKKKDGYWIKKDEERKRILKAGKGLLKDDMDREAV